MYLFYIGTFNVNFCGLAIKKIPSGASGKDKNAERACSCDELRIFFAKT